MELGKASRKKVKIKMGLQGPSGSGKTYSALLLAFGLCNDWNKIAVVDTENHSSDLYSHLGEYNSIPISPPFTPEKYIQALSICEKAGMQVVIMDSITHCWENLLDYHSSLPGNSFTNWSKVTPRQNEFVQKILQSPSHVISTIRTKQDYVLSEKNGKMVPEKVGLKSVQRDGLDYEFTLVFDLDMKHHALASKDRTGLFAKLPECKITPETGEKILAWCEQGEEAQMDPIEKRINCCKSIDELLYLFQQQDPNIQQLHSSSFTKRRQELATKVSSPVKISSNGRNSS